jgi:hypothetical protein
MNTRTARSVSQMGDEANRTVLRSWRCTASVVIATNIRS